MKEHTGWNHMHDLTDDKLLGIYTFMTMGQISKSVHFTFLCNFKPEISLCLFKSRSTKFSNINFPRRDSIVKFKYLKNIDIAIYCFLFPGAAHLACLNYSISPCDYNKKGTFLERMNCLCKVKIKQKEIKNL